MLAYLMTSYYSSLIVAHTIILSDLMRYDYRPAAIRVYYAVRLYSVLHLTPPALCCPVLCSRIIILPDLMRSYDTDLRFHAGLLMRYDYLADEYYECVYSTSTSSTLLILCWPTIVVPTIRQG